MNQSMYFSLKAKYFDVETKRRTADRGDMKEPINCRKMQIKLRTLAVEPASLALYRRKEVIVVCLYSCCRGFGESRCGSLAPRTTVRSPEPNAPLRRLW